MRKLFNDIEKAIRNHVTLLHVSATESEVRYAIRWIMRDNPDIFWFCHQYRYDYRTSSVEFRYQFLPQKVRLLQQSINEVVEEDFQIGFVRTLSPDEQVMYVYKWLINYCNYNPESAFNQGIDSVFVRRNSVCTGYAKAAQYLFNLLGIESILAFGRLKNDREGGRHCWNIVKLNGKYYHLDICFGDLCLCGTLTFSGIQNTVSYGDGLLFNFFCVSTDVIRQNRSVEDLEIIPECNENLDDESVCRLAHSTAIQHRDDYIGCKLTAFGSSADIHLCTADKHIVLKLFRDHNKCIEEYHHMQKLSGCKGLLQLRDYFTDIRHNIIAIEQSTPIVDLFCSHYYEPTFASLLSMISDIAYAWIECKERGVLYRDIHICNIYKTNTGKYKLGDFGSCTEDFSKRETVGNQWFMAPETYVDGIFDERSAIYAITMVLYFVLNDLKPVFCDKWDEQIALEKRISGEALPYPSSVSYSSDLDNFLKTGGARLPNDRFTSMESFIDELYHLSNDHRIAFNHAPHLPLTRDNVPIPIGRDWHHKYAIGSADQIENDFGLSMSCSPTPPPTFSRVDEIESRCYTMGCSDPYASFPITYESAPQKKNTSLWSKLFNERRRQHVYSSVFAPAEIRPNSHMLVQVFLHLFNETDTVNSLAKESYKYAERRDYSPLQCELKKGDKVDITLNIYGATQLMSEKKSLVWQGSFEKRSFDYYIPKGIDVDELSCMVLLTVNNALVGEMHFITEIGEQPRKLNPNVLAHQYHKIFISYAHEDEEKVEQMARAYKAQGVEYFFDRHYLKPGDIFPLKIQEFIDTSDLFILCWSANAAKSDYVELERQRALKRAYPQVKPIEKAELFIYPMSIEPRAELPDDMKDVQFEVIYSQSVSAT